MNITGLCLLRFKSNGGKVSWNTSVKYTDSENKPFYVTYPTTLKKEVEEQVKKEFKSRKWSKEDKFIVINVKKGFLSAFTNKEGQKVTKFVITELECSKPDIKKTDKVDDPFGE